MTSSSDWTSLVQCPFSPGDLSGVRALLNRAVDSANIADLDEHLLLTRVQATARLWKQGARIVGFAFLDDYNNLWFELDSRCDLLPHLESEIVEWGLACARTPTGIPGLPSSLDCSSSVHDAHRIDMLQRHGFMPDEVYSLRYSRSLSDPIAGNPVPTGFQIRPVKSVEEVAQLVALHQASFGTQNLTVEQRLAMMNASHYRRELDLVVVAPGGELAAFCVAGWHDQARGLARTDPIGTHPRFRRLGLARAVVSHGLALLKQSGARTVTLGTSSDNLAMRKLAEDLGFVCVAERLWFSRALAPS
jgi:ribosomal protein S18 acetylase RimI-like enzyme